MKRFAEHTEGEILAKRANVIPYRTVAANKGASTLFKAYLEEKKQDTNFESFDTVRLAENLGHFYIDIRTKTGELYKSTSLQSVRHGLNRYLKSPPHLKRYDIITGEEFNDANECFKTAMAELKVAGKGNVEHYPEINITDLSKLYESGLFSPDTPCGLGNRVQMNIRLYFCRRANENMETMTKGTFAVHQYPDTKSKYVVKVVDEMSKNHRECDRESVSGHMPAAPELGECCPVVTFEKYVAKLNTSSDRLWQYPRDSFNAADDCWYQNRPIGRDSLRKFISSLSKKVGLTQIYTNHSIRVTGASILSSGMYSPAQIMSVTGHKSVSSLAVYQRVSDQEKQSMGRAISSTISGRDPSQLALPSTGRMALTAGPSTGSNSLVPISGRAVDQDLDIFDGVDVSDLFCNFDDIPVMGASLFTSALSQKIRRIRWDSKRKSRPSACSMINGPAAVDESVKSPKRFRLQTTADVEGEDSDDYESHVRELATEVSKKEPNANHIKTLLKASLRQRRKWIGALPAGNVSSILEMFPCFRTPIFVSCSLERYVHIYISYSNL